MQKREREADVEQEMWKERKGIPQIEIHYILNMKSSINVAFYFLCYYFFCVCVFSCNFAQGSLAAFYIAIFLTFFWELNLFMILRLKFFNKKFEEILSEF